MSITLNTEALEKYGQFTNDYALIASYHFDTIQKRTVLGERLGYCRFCKRKHPDVSFKTEAHALPQFIGNRYLLSYYECDSCNKLFSETIENETANFMKLLHTTYGVKGESKVPTHKNNGVRFESNGVESNINITDMSLLVGDLNDKEFYIKSKSEKFIPSAVYKCLTKMALSIMSDEDIAYCSRTFSWIQEGKGHKELSVLDNLFLIYSQTSSEMSFPYISAVVYKKKSIASNSLPSFIFILSYANFSFQIYLPFSDLDAKETFPVEGLGYCPHILDMTHGLESSQKVIFDFSSNEKCEIPTSIEVVNLD